MGETIHVNRAHIEGGIKEMGSSCMVAKAIREQLDLTEDYSVVVSYSGANIWRAGLSPHVKAELPPNVGQRIRRWDRNAKTKPFSFELDLPADWREQLRAK